jgi:hypothetical protein
VHVCRLTMVIRLTFSSIGGKSLLRFKVESDAKDDMHFSLVILNGAYGNRSPASLKTGSEFWYWHAPDESSHAGDVLRRK